LLGQSIGAAAVALVFALAQGGHGAATAILIAAGFTGIAIIASLSRMADFVRVPRADVVRTSSAAAEYREPAE